MPPLGGGLFGGQLQACFRHAARAAPMLGNRSLTLPKGTAFTCALKTQVISAASGLVGCQVQRNVYSDDGRVLLIERGSHLDGEYRIASVRPGTVRIPVLWTRIRTPHGVTVDIESPGTGPLGESGIDGYVDNRWPERIGAAMLLSVIDDSVKLVIAEAGQRATATDTVVLPSTTSNTSKLAEKVLDSTINIPPLIYQNQGGIVGIYVARDVDFSSVYELKAGAAVSARSMPAQADPWRRRSRDCWRGDATSVDRVPAAAARAAGRAGRARGLRQPARRDAGRDRPTAGSAIAGAGADARSAACRWRPRSRRSRDQQINQERPLLAATLPSGERIQFVIPPAVTRGTVSITIRKPSAADQAARRLRARRPLRAHGDRQRRTRPSESAAASSRSCSP